jgi:hypothetical protein
MTKFAPYSRRTLRVRRRAWVRRNLAPLWALAGLVTAMIAGSVVLARAIIEAPLGWYLLGCFHVALVGIVLYLGDVAFMASDREAIQHVRGAWGEDNTRNELQIARRRRLVWGWVDSITLEVGDIDHVVVTRSGGVVAIDSKWRNAIDRGDIEQMARSARRAASRAEGLGGQLLRTSERSKAKHRSKSRPLTVTPVVVVWGAAQHDLPEDAAHDGVRFIAGLQLRQWLSDQHHDPIDRAAARHFLSALKDWRAIAWAANVS